MLEQLISRFAGLLSILILVLLIPGALACTNEATETPVPTPAQFADDVGTAIPRAAPTATVVPTVSLEPAPTSTIFPPSPTVSSEPTATPDVMPTPESTILPPVPTASPEPTATPDVMPTPESTILPPGPPPPPEPTDPGAADGAPPATKDRHGNDITSATSIRVGEPTKGNINYQGDTDYFSFHSEAGQTYRIDLYPPSLLGQTLDSPSPLVLYDSGGTKLADIDQLTVWTAPSPGNYYVAVTPNEIGYYGLTVGPVCRTGNTVHEWTTESFWRAADLALVQAVLTNCFTHLLAQPTIKDGTSPLFLAARYNENPAVMQALLEAGANPEAREYYDSGSLLSWAAGYNLNPEVIQVLLDAGVSQDTKDNSLFWAVENTENPAALKVLLDAGANINARSSYDGRTPLHQVARHTENPAAIQVLVGAGADVNAKADTGETPLYRASRSTGNPAVLQALLEAGADVNAATDTGETPLYRASRSTGNPAVMQVLLDAGADVNASTSDGDTPLHRAARNIENPAMVEILLDAGADVEAKTSIEPSIVRHYGVGFGATPLHHAAFFNGNPAVLQALLDAGADIEARNSEGETPLDLAMKAENSSAVQVLKENGASHEKCPTGTTEREWVGRDFWRTADQAQVQAELDCGANVAAGSGSDGTPLHFAAGISNNPAVIHALLDAGADIEAKTGDDRWWFRGLTPLDYAAMFNYNPLGKDDLMEFEDLDAELREAAAYYENPVVLLALLDAGANIEAGPGKRPTALHGAAAFNYNPAVVRALLDAGSNPDAKGSDGITPLHLAAEGNPNPAVAQALLDAGANINATNTNGETPLHLVAAHNAVLVVLQALLDAGADINAKNSEGETPLAMAIKHDNRPAIQMLQDNIAKQ